MSTTVERGVYSCFVIFYSHFLLCKYGIVWCCICCECANNLFNMDMFENVYLFSPHPIPIESLWRFGTFFTQFPLAHEVCWITVGKLDSMHVIQYERNMFDFSLLTRAECPVACIHIFSCERCQVDFGRFDFVNLHSNCIYFAHSVLDYRFEWDCNGSSAVVCRPFFRMCCLEWKKCFFHYPFNVKLIHWRARKWAIINNYSFIQLSAFLFPIQWIHM